MSCQGIPLVTKGMIFRPKVITNEIIKECSIPYTIDFNQTKFKLDLTQQPVLNISTNINTKSINLTKKQFTLAPKLFKNFKLNLKKCEE